MPTPYLPAVVSAIALALAAPAQDAGAPSPADADAEAVAVDTASTMLTEAERAAALERVSTYLNGIDTMRGRFLQTASDGSAAEGAFFIDRPGRARFEYDPPHPSLIVSDGATVAHQDRELDSTDRVPIGQTPLNLFLKSDVDLARDADIVSVEESSGELAVTARDASGETEGEITLVFNAPALELREWVITDSLDQRVRVSLLDVENGVDIDARLFVLRDDRPRRRGPR